MDSSLNRRQKPDAAIYAISVMIVRYINDDPQPGIVECRFTDAWGREWAFIDKTAIFSVDDIDATSEYPRSGLIGCKIIKHWNDADEREVITVDTVLP